VNLGGLDVNISSLYLLMGEFDSADQAAQRGLDESEHGGYPDGISRSLMQLTVIRARQGRIEESIAEVARAADIAYREQPGDGSGSLGSPGAELLERGELSLADRAMTEGYRLRKLHHLTKIDTSYFNLVRVASRAEGCGIRLTSGGGGA
jgi:hypothetical protein